MLLKDAIEIPTQLSSQDFVLRLTEGVTEDQAKTTLDQYVITPNIAKNFEQALGILQSALGLTIGGDGSLVEGPHQNRAAYLHGSFGSGKSHFMAVLHLLLNGDPRALNRKELAEVVAKHRAWLGKKKLLLVPYHMLGAETFEQKVFEDYCHYVHGLFPDAELPALFDADALIQDAENLRSRLGDDSFFQSLGNEESEEGWGDLAGSWDQARYESVVAKPATNPERQELANFLASTLFSGTTRDMGTVRFDKGLERMTKHAQELGFDGVVLFLDELILWLASKAGNADFLRQEIDKIVNLVEAQRMDRPIPIVGFIARQRDLRELIGADQTGAGQLAIDDKLSHHQGRFQMIEMSTANLPEIASRRLLVAKDAAGAQAIDAEFAKLKSLMASSSGTALREALLGEHTTLDDFRKVYPFSPALVDTLVDAAAMLQRDRTALRAMLQLLVEHRDHLEVGQVIPVGDLYDVISSGNDAITPAFEAKFDRAQKFYRQQLVPLLEKAHGTAQKEIDALPWGDAKRVKWRADDRILKTVLLSHLVPQVTALKDLTPQRIAALNHGSITTIIPGQEAQVVMRKLREWSAEVTELQLTGDAANPQVALTLHGVDVEGVLKNAASNDNHGNRVILLRSLVFQELGIREGELETRFEFPWQGTKREAKVLFRNLGDLPLASLKNDGNDWQVVIDYPIDADPDGAGKDDAKIAEFRGQANSARTLIWRPCFLNQKGRDELGRLVRLESILKSDQRFEAAATHLSTQDRLQAKPMLVNQRETLRTKMLGTLMAAYGLSNDPSFQANLDGAVEVRSTFVSLDEGFDPRPPATNTFKDGLESFLKQALASQFPKAPHWEQAFGRADLKRALEIALEAASNHPSRVELDSTKARLMRGFAVPLDLGKCAGAFELGGFWRDHFNSHLRQSGDDAATVASLRDWTDEPEPRGLPRDVQDLLAIVYAAQDERAFFRAGAPLQEGAVSIGGLQPDDELRRIPLPSEEAWKVSLDRAAAIFGESNPGLYLNGPNVASLANRVRQHVREGRRDAQALRAKLHEVTPVAQQAESLRCHDADAVLDLFERLDVEDAKQLIEQLAAARIEGDVTPASMAASWRQARSVIDAIDGMNWALVRGAEGRRTDPKVGKQAMSLLARLQVALQSHQLAVELGPELRAIEAETTALLTQPVVTAGPPEVPPSVGPDGTGETREPGIQGGTRIIHGTFELETLTREWASELEQPGTRIDLTWEIRREGNA